MNTSRTYTIIIVLLLAMMGLNKTYAASPNPTPAPKNLPPHTISVTPDEIKSLGCLIVGTSIASATILLSGTSIFFLGGRGAATVGVIAAPVLAAATFTGCSFGSQIALGVTWLYKNHYLKPWKMFDLMVTSKP